METGIDDLVGSVEETIESLYNLMEAIRSADLYYTLRNAEFHEELGKPGWDLRNLIPDLEGKEHGWMGDGGFIDTLQALVEYLEGSSVEEDPDDEEIE